MAREKLCPQGCGPGTCAVPISRLIETAGGAGTVPNPGPPFSMAGPGCSGNLNVCRP